MSDFGNLYELAVQQQAYIAELEAAVPPATRSKFKRPDEAAMNQFFPQRGEPTPSVDAPKTEAKPAPSVGAAPKAETKPAPTAGEPLSEPDRQAVAKPRDGDPKR